MPSKSEAHDALVELQERLEGDKRSLELVDIMDRFAGGLRRQRSELSEKVEALSKARAGDLERLAVLQDEAKASTLVVTELRQRVQKLESELSATATEVEEVLGEPVLFRPELGSHTLVPGVQCKAPSDKELAERVAGVKSEVEHFLPEFATAVRTYEQKKLDLLMVHQDAFAAAYDFDEFTLLGLAVKYAGMHSVTIQVIGRNGETLHGKTERGGDGVKEVSGSTHRAIRRTPHGKRDP